MPVSDKERELYMYWDACRLLAEGDPLLDGQEFLVAGALVSDWPLMARRCQSRLASFHGTELADAARQ